MADALGLFIAKSSPQAVATLLMAKQRRLQSVQISGSSSSIPSAKALDLKKEKE